MKKYFYLIKFIFLLLVIWFSSCRSIDRIFVGKPMGELTEAQLTDIMLANELQYNTLFFRRLIANIDHQGQSRSVRANMFIEHNQQIIISVIPFMGIEAIRVKLDQDQVQIIDRINREYSSATYAQLSNRFNVPLNFETLERILTNRLFEFPNNNFSNIRRFRGETTENYYSLKSHDDRAYARMIDNKSFDLYQRIDILPEVYRILNSFVNQPANNVSLGVKYSDFRSFSEREIFPYKISIKGNMGTQKAKLELELNHIERNSDSSIGFSIPSNYERVNF